MLNVILALFILANYKAGAATETKLGSGDDTTSEFATNTVLLGSGSGFSEEDEPSSNLTCAEQNIESSNVPLYPRTLMNITESFRIIYALLVLIVCVPMNAFIFLPRARAQQG